MGLDRATAGAAPGPAAAPLRFEFATAGRIVFGAGTLREAGEIMAGMGRRTLVVTGGTPERAQPLSDLLAGEGLAVANFVVSGEPDVETVRRGAALARAEACDSVIGFGGGAVLDAAKALAILTTNPGEVTEYLEIIGQGRALTQAGLPMVAIPTTAGTGSEVTRNSVIVSREHRVKVSLRSPLMLPKVALVDPELTHGLPPAITAATGVDALTQVIEPFVSTRANPLTDGLCREGIARAARSLRRVYASSRTIAGSRVGVGSSADSIRLPGPEAAAAREDMAVSSLFGGLALTNAGLGAVHGLAGPLGGMIVAPHGALCAALLPAVVSANLRALRERAPQSPALPRYAEVARILTGEPAATGDDAIVWLRRLIADLEIPGLRTYGVGAAIIEELVEKASRASSMKPNPVMLTPAELAGVVEEAL